jgi:hypothetical protein
VPFEETSTPNRHFSSREWALILGVYGLLTWLVWGVFAFDRGFWHDDVMPLAMVQARLGQPVSEVLAPIGTPTRFLIGAPVWLGLVSGKPLALLQWFYGASWFLIGLVTLWLALELGTGRRGAFLAGAFALCATSDYLTNSMVSLFYNLSALGYFAAVAAVCRWVRSGRAWWLILCAMGLSLSVWTSDGAFSSIVLSPALFLLITPFRVTRRFIVSVVWWFIVLIPYFLIFVRFLTDPTSYAARAIEPLPMASRAKQTMELFIHNFVPWVWAFDRPVWYPGPAERVVPLSVYGLATLAGTGAVILALVRLRDRPPDVSRKTALIKAALSLVLALAANAMFAGVQFSEAFLRTHTVSRIWVSLVVATLLTEIITGAWLRRLAMPAAITAFVSLGLYGGMERQDFFLSYWREHQVELASIIEQAPRIKRRARLVLHTPPLPRIQATEALYLARSWIALLYGDGAVASRTIHWSPERNSGCVAESVAWRCWNEGEADCFRAGQCTGQSVPYSDAILMTFDERSGRFVLQNEIPPDLAGTRVSDTTTYRPRALIQRRPIRDFTRSMIYPETTLGKLLTTKRPHAVEEAP